QLERGGERAGLLLVDGHLEGDVAGKLAEPAHTGDDERLAQRQRPDRRTRGLAHRWRPQREDSVARVHQRPEPLLVDVVDANQTIRLETEPLQATIEIEPG